MGYKLVVLPMICARPSRAATTPHFEDFGRCLQQNISHKEMPLVESYTVKDDLIVVEFANDENTKFHAVWLRDNCHCELCYYDITKQRLVNLCLIDLDIRPASVAVNSGLLEVIWPDGHKSSYQPQWLRLHSYNPSLVQGDKLPPLATQALWKVADIENALPKVDFKEVMESQSAVNEWVMKIWKHGFCLVDNVPVQIEATRRLCERLDYIRPTHYGGFWDFTSDLLKNDTAYTNFDISSHTDGTYWSDTPGLQLFHLLYHDGEGGTTSLIDAFQCAEILRTQHPKDFEFLCQQPIPAHSAGEETVCIQPDVPQPVFKLDHKGQLIQVRWNMSDRSTMSVWSNPDTDVPRFYRAIKNWYRIITDRQNEFFYQMQPGQALIFDNWRCFHSRTEFTGKRTLCGAYFNRDDFVSKVKLLSLGRETLLESL